MSFFDIINDALHSVSEKLRKTYNLYKYGVEVADIKHRDHSWRTSPIHLAIFQNNVERVADLIRRGACIEPKLNSGRYGPLHMAVVLDRPKIVDLLVTANADVNSVNTVGWTPLHMAVLLGNDDIVRRLMKGKADLNKKAGDEVKFEFRTQFIPIAPIRTILRNRVTELATKGINKYAVTTDDTPLHFAATIGLTKIVSTLIGAMANINEVNKDGQTPLHVAVEYGHLDIVKMLIDAGADLEIVDKQGNTPYDIAVVKGIEMKINFPNSYEMEVVTIKKNGKSMQPIEVESNEPDLAESKHKQRLG